MGKPKGYPSPVAGRRLPRRRPQTTSPVLEKLMAIMDADERSVAEALGSRVNKVTVSRWRSGAQQSADLRTVETAGEAYGYRLKWEKIT